MQRKKLAGAAKANRSLTPFHVTFLFGVNSRCPYGNPEIRVFTSKSVV
jgi:hypothetical protein